MTSLGEGAAVHIGRRPACIPLPPLRRIIPPSPHTRAANPCLVDFHPPAAGIGQCATLDAAREAGTWAG